MSNSRTSSLLRILQFLLSKLILEVNLIVGGIKKKGRLFHCKRWTTHIWL